VKRLKLCPVVNGRIDGDDFIQLNNFYDIGVAVGIGSADLCAIVVVTRIRKVLPSWSATSPITAGRARDRKIET